MIIRPEKSLVRVPLFLYLSSLSSFISNSRSNHCFLELTDHKIKIPTEMMQNLMILHSYILVKVSVTCPRKFNMSLVIELFRSYNNLRVVFHALV